jgi:hypothetical protein
MFVAVWRFTTSDPAAFESHYGSDGTWARFFRGDPAYVRTDLLVDGEAYLTLDWWMSRAAYDAFRESNAAEYARIDRICEVVTVTEERLGEYEEVIP